MSSPDPNQDEHSKKSAHYDDSNRVGMDLGEEDRIFDDVDSVWEDHKTGCKVWQVVAAAMCDAVWGERSNLSTDIHIELIPSATNEHTHWHQRLT